MGANHFYCKMGVFLGITGLCVWGANIFILRAGATYKDGSAIICERKREAVQAGLADALSGRDAVLFLGDSKILAGIIPDKFDILVNRPVRSWNLSLPALKIGPGYFLLRNYLRRNPPPEFIVVSLVLDYGEHPSDFDGYACQGARFREMASYAVHRKDKTAVWNYIFPLRIYREATLKYISSLLLDREDIMRAHQRNDGIVKEMLRSRGYYFIAGLAQASGCLPDDFKVAGDGAPEKPLDLNRDAFVHRFFRLTQEQGISVLLIETPLRVGQRQPRTTIPLWYQQLMAQYSNVHLACEGWRFRYYENRLFSDAAHLNKQGAERFTSEIAAEFAEVFGAQSNAPLPAVEGD